MIQDFVDAWLERKDIYEDWIKSLNQEERRWSLSYSDLVKKLIEVVINPYLIDSTELDYFEGYDIDKMTIIDDGEYQGTLIFIIPEDTYQPDVSDYIYTTINYGSCTVCDALECALSQEKEDCIKQLMTISLHLIEGFKYLYEREK